MSPSQLAKKIGILLKQQGKTLAIAESCTGGFISHLITAVPGSSAYYTGGVVSYDNKVKTELLGVKSSTLKKVGAVSSDCAIQMAKGVRKKLAADCSLATTGIAGPSGAVPGKPVGTVYISCAVGRNLRVEKFLFTGTRRQIIAQSAQKALQLLLEELS